MDREASFPLLGEPLALDLVNTRVQRDGAVVDLLETPRALDAWLRAERARLPWRGRADAADLRAVCTLRHALDELLVALRTHARPRHAAIAVVNRSLAEPQTWPRLAWGAAGPCTAPTPAGARRSRLLQTLAADAVSLLTGSSAARIRKCAHPDCRLQFVAVNPKRRWCSGATCGNRARVARHYQKQRVA